MGDLHSIAYSTPGYCTSSSLGWEFQNLGVFNTDMSPLVMGSSTPPYFFSSFDSDCSTGYLEDALFEFSSKRRRLMLFSNDQTNYSTSPIQSCWKEDVNEIYPDNFGCMKQMINKMDNRVAGNVLNSKNKEVTTFEEVARPVSQGTNTDSSSSSPIHKDSLNIKSISETPDSLASGGGDMEECRKKVMTRVVCPFAVVKPGGSEGDVTLDDINERISMTPTRPVRHPVGDFACRPIVSPNGLGLSGKAVVALTRIQTQGRGTITIIRTRG